MRALALLTVLLVAAPGALVLAGQMGTGGPAPTPDLTPAVHQSLLSTVYHSVRRVEYQHYLARSVATGGGLTVMGSSYLLATGDGDLFQLTWGDGDSLVVDTLRLRVPLNAAAYGAEAGVRRQWFRVADLLAQVEGDQLRLFASHHFWNSAEKCFVLRVSMLETVLPLTPQTQAPWTTIYDTKPCVGLKQRGHQFAGIQSGGKMALLDDDRMLLTVGDHQFDGVFDDQLYPQDLSVDYGKTLIISIGRGTAERFTAGHRNQQGLWIDADGTIWQTEHGPRGGDELNVLRSGANYGWPLATYGTEYGSTRWPPALKHGEHDDFEKPFFSWVPSIGVTSLVRIEGRQFEEWRGDLLIASLLEKSLYRMRIRDGRVAYVERLEVGLRVRDIREGPDGRVVMSTEEGTIISLRPDPSTDVGLVAYGACVSCHRVGDGTSHLFGPDLFGVVGRGIASSANFNYSTALRGVGGEWTEQRLDAFLADPERFAPGTAMTSEGIADPEARRRLIEYLKTQK